MTEIIYAQILQKCLRPNTKRRVSVNGMLRKLDVSRSDYNDWLHREPSEQKKRKQRVKQQIQLIYDQSHQNYGAPKICNRLQYDNEIITERTVGK